LAEQTTQSVSANTIHILVVELQTIEVEVAIVHYAKHRRTRFLSSTSGLCEDWAHFKCWEKLYRYANGAVRKETPCKGLPH